MQFDEQLDGLQLRGPTRTPPIPDYLQDGEYKDVSKQYEVQYADMKKFMTTLLVRNRRRKKKTDEDEADD